VGLRLRAVLQGEHPFHGEARVGAAFISEEDRLAWEDARRERHGDAGPERLEALANVAEWRPVAVTPSASGGTLGPVPVPRAPRYRVLAWEPDGTFWWGDLVVGERLSLVELDEGGAPTGGLGPGEAPATSELYEGGPLTGGVGPGEMLSPVEQDEGGPPTGGLGPDERLSPVELDEGGSPIGSLKPGEAPATSELDVGGPPTGSPGPGEAPATGELDVGVLRARRPTGVRVRLAGARPEQGAFSVRVSRVVASDARDAERASELLPVVRHAAPALAEALAEGTFLPLSPAEDTPLLPLPPDPAVRLWLRAASGLEAGPVEVALREGRVERVTLDVDALFPRGVGRRVTLRGRVLLEATSRPPPGARLRGPEGQALALAADGRFTAEGLPSWRPSRFTVELEAPASGRPVAPSRQDFDFLPEPGVAEAAVTWRVPAFRWLVLRMDAFARERLGARRPYPVFLLQRRDAEGRWLTQAAEAFVPEDAGMAVSILQPGTYRVLAAASPYEVHASDSVPVDGRDVEHSVPLRVAADGRHCEVRVTRAGAPVYGALVTAGSGSLPPVRGRTDAEGRWRLGTVRTSSLHLEVEADGDTPWADEASEACAASGVVEVRL
jgi:hypothetical protein